jgi:nucleotide-binding universal stress UspA family protein
VAKFGGELHLVHIALVPRGRTEDGVSKNAVRAELDRRRRLLAELADETLELGARTNIEVLEGLPDEQVLRYSSENDIDAIVVAPVGDRRGQRGHVGSVAKHLIKGAGVPVLVVREEGTIADWVSGKRPLRILVGADPSKPAQAALDWLVAWKRAGSVDLCAGHVYVPGSERLHDETARFERKLAGSIRQRILHWPELGEPRVRVLAGFGRPAFHLLEIATAERADLLVVGTHRRDLVDQWVHGSVSLDIVGSAHCNVVTVPLPSREPAETGIAAS